MEITMDRNETCKQLLNTLSNRTLWPLAKRLGGVPVTTLQAVGATHIGAMQKRDLIDALVHHYGPDAISLTLTEMREGKPEVAPAKPADDATALAEAIRRVASGSINAEQVRSIVADEIDALRAEMVTTVRIERTDAPAINVGVQHRNFPTLLKMVNCRLPNGRRLNVWLHGPAGTGKTSAARKAAEALGLKFFFSGAIETAYALMGYTDAHGRLVRTPFRDAWEHGGVFLMDEVDASHPQALAALNAAIDGGVCAFPDGMIERHADTIIIAGANTVGRGGDSKYAGRVRQDEAFLSRYTLLEWAHDDALETAIVGDDEAAREMLRMVRALREAAKAQRIEGASLTTRASLDGSALLRAGLDKAMVLESTVRKGMPKETWDRLIATAGI